MPSSWARCSSLILKKFICSFKYRQSPHISSLMRTKFVLFSMLFKNAPISRSSFICCAMG